MTPRLFRLFPLVLVAGALAQTPMSDPWLQVHGADLDADHDGVITAAELLDDAGRGFAAYDLNADGIISAAELAARGDYRAGSEFAGLVYRHFPALDSSGDGAVTREEFLTAARYIFNTADRDADGTVSAAEWRTAPNAPLPIPPGANPAAPITPAPSTPVATPGTARLVNLATRAQVGGAAGFPIAGFVLGGAGTRPVVVRAVGPTLAGFGVADAVADPAIGLQSGSTTLAANDTWLAADATAFAALGAFPLRTGAADAALVATLGPGAYTTPLSAPGHGIALLEIYDGAPAAIGATLINASARAYVGTGDQVLVPGFVIAGTGTLKLLLRAVGPGLAVFGVPGLLADPQLTLYRGSTALATNDNWSGATISAAATAVGAPALGAGSKDAALLVTLEAGAYSAVISGVANTTGTALVEIYVVP